MSAFSSVLKAIGLRKTKPASVEKFPLGYQAEEIAIWREATPFTMTDKRRVLSLITAVRYIERCGIAGDIVECGVWKGGSMMAAARTLMNLKSMQRALFLFDTYEGMVQPTAKDVGSDEVDARVEFGKTRFADREGSDWCYSPLDEVKKNLGLTGYPAEKLHFIKGKVEDTLPAGAPPQIALLRLDTDWYESTRWEMQHLYPRLSVGGIIIIDDYLYWRGSRQAVDEYVAQNEVKLFLDPIDGGGVIGVKQG